MVLTRRVRRRCEQERGENRRRFDLLVICDSNKTQLYTLIVLFIFPSFTLHQYYYYYYFIFRPSSRLQFRLLLKDHLFLDVASLICQQKAVVDSVVDLLPH